MEQMTYSTGDLAKKLGISNKTSQRHVKRLEQYFGPVTRNARSEFRLSEQEVARVEATSKMMSEGTVSSYEKAYELLLKAEATDTAGREIDPAHDTETIAKTINIDPLNGSVINPNEAPAVPINGSSGEAKMFTNEPDNGSDKTTEKGALPLLNDLSQRLKNWWTVVRREVF